MSSGITYKFKNDIGSKKLPPQLVTIINLVKEAGETGIDREALIAKLTEGNKLNTRQPVERVVSYYHTRMEELDAVTIIKPAKVPAVAKMKEGGKKETVVIGVQDVGAIPPGVVQSATAAAGATAPTPGAATPRAKAVV